MKKSALFAVVSELDRLAVHPDKEAAMSQERLKANRSASLPEAYPPYEPRISTPSDRVDGSIVSR